MKTTTLTLLMLILLLYYALQQLYENFSGDKKAIYFVCFADKKYEKTLKRIVSEAKTMKVFTKIFDYNDDNLKQDWEHWDFVRQNSRGFGYWIWKPYVILETLKKTKRGSYLVYADAGCTLQSSKTSRLLQYIELAEKSPKKMLTFEMSWSKEGDWTKMDTLRYLDFTKTDQLESPQIHATTFILKNTDETEKFIQLWYDTMRNYHLLTDSKGSYKDYDTFQEHRHDQSIFSILVKKYGILHIPDETGSGPIVASRKKF